MPCDLTPSKILKKALREEEHLKTRHRIYCKPVIFHSESLQASCLKMRRGDAHGRLASEPKDSECPGSISRLPLIDPSIQYRRLR